MGDPVIETIAREYLQSMQEADVDTLILGCTTIRCSAMLSATLWGRM